MRKSSLRVTAGRYSVNQPLSAAAAHPMVDQFTEELYKKMPEKYGSLAGRKSICMPTNAQLISTTVLPPPPPAQTGTDGGSDSGAEILLPVPSKREQRRESLLNPRKHGFDFTLPSSTNIDKTHTAAFVSQERRQSRTPRKPSVSHERRHSKSLESLKGPGRSILDQLPPPKTEDILNQTLARAGRIADILRRQVLRRIMKGDTQNPRQKERREDIQNQALQNQKGGNGRDQGLRLNQIRRGQAREEKDAIRNQVQP